MKVLNKKYIVGDESIACSYDFDKHRIETKILVNLAISQFVEEGATVKIVVGMPVEHWLDRERRAKYEQFISSNMPMSLIKSGREQRMSFNIIKCVAVPETMGHVIVNKEFKKRVVGVLDCGGCNFQGAIYKNAVPLRDTCFTMNEGGNFFLNSVKKAINSKFALNYQDYQIQELIENGTDHPQKAEIEAEVKRVTESHFNKVLRECKARNWNLNDMKIRVVGGGSNYFKDVIMDMLPNATVSNNEVWDNADGFSILAGGLYGETK